MIARIIIDLTIAALALLWIAYCVDGFWREVREDWQ